jgi:hypothetical protein
VQNKYAIMERTYCFDGTRVVSADGKPLGKAKIVVDATKAGTGLGYTSLGVIGGSDVNEYIQKNGAAPPGQAAFRSAATVGLRWEVPLVGTIINVKPQWLQELPIIVDKDGLANCRGGSRAGSFLSSDRRSRATVGLVHVLRTRIRRDAVTGRHGTAPTPRRAGLGHSRTRHAADDRQVCTARPLWSADQLGP